MSEQKPDQVKEEELEEQEGQQLPDREVMSVITPNPEGDVFPADGDPGDYW